MRYEYRIKCFAYQLLFSGLTKGEVYYLTIERFPEINDKELCRLVDSVDQEIGRQDGYYDPKIPTTLGCPSKWVIKEERIKSYSIPKKR